MTRADCDKADDCHHKNELRVGVTLVASRPRIHDARMQQHTSHRDAKQPGVQHAGDGPAQVVPRRGVIAGPVRCVAAGARERGPEAITKVNLRTVKGLVPRQLGMRRISLPT